MTPYGVNEYLGDYQYYLEKKQQQQIQLRENEARQQQIVINTVSEGKADWLKQKQQQAEQRKAEAKINKVEKEIEQTEKEIEQLDKMLFQEEISSDFSKAQQLFEQKTKLEKHLEQLYEKWEEMQ